MKNPALPPAGDDLDSSVDDIGALVEQLRRVVAARRASGEYPEDMEEELDEHFLRAVPGALDALDLDTRLRLVDKASLIGRHRLYTDSRMPLGSAVHKTVGRVVVRQTNSLLEQMSQFAAAVRAMLHAIVERLPEEDFRDTAARVDVILDRLASYERVPDTADPVVRALAARLDRLETWMNAASAPPGQFDGAAWTAADAEALRAAAARLELGEPVLDLATEPDPEQATGALEARPDATLGAVLVLSGAERLPAQGIRNLLGAAACKLRSGGALAMALCESPVLTGTNVDGRSVLTWAPGLNTEAAAELARAAGFGDVRVERIAAPPEEPAAPGGEAAPALVEELRRLRARVAELEGRTRPYLLVCTR